MRSYQERAVTFGPAGSLVGILSTPTAEPGPNAPTVVIPNAGVIHRVGANRLHVRLARALASHGCIVLRFDLSGIGDSDPRAEPLGLDESAQCDMADALTYLQDAHQIKSFVVFGLCSGANIGFTFSVHDSRVTDAVLVDPASYPTWRSYVKYYAPRVLRPQSLLNVLTGRHRSVRRAIARLAGERTPPDERATHTVPSGPTKEQMRAGLRTLIDRDATVLVVFSAGLQRDYNYRSQFRHTFPAEVASGNIRVEYFASADHTFSGERQKGELIGLVREWLHERPLDSARGKGRV